MPDEETITRIVGMKRAGITTPVIAQRVGLTRNVVARICRKVGAYAKLDHSSGRALNRRWYDPRDQYDAET